MFRKAYSYSSVSEQQSTGCCDGCLKKNEASRNPSSAMWFYLVKDLPADQFLSLKGFFRYLTVIELMALGTFTGPLILHYPIPFQFFDGFIYEEKTESSSCRCLTRIPYATLIATVLCCTGVGVFLGSFYRGISLTLRTFEEVFQFRFDWLNDLHIVFIIIGGVMGAFSLILLLVGFLATGATRERVYRGFKSRMGGRVSCAFFMALTYILELVWLLVFVSLVLIAFVFSVWWGMCNNLKNEPIPENRCIDLKPLSFLFPSGTDINLLRICDDGKKKNFCKDCVEPSEMLFLVSLSASFLVVLSLIHYLMCLSANYARIKDNEKFQELQELQYLQDTEMGTLSKDRF